MPIKHQMYCMGLTMHLVQHKLGAACNRVNYFQQECKIPIQKCIMVGQLVNSQFTLHSVSFYYTIFLVPSLNEDFFLECSQYELNFVCVCPYLKVLKTGHLAGSLKDFIISCQIFFLTYQKHPTCSQVRSKRFHHFQFTPRHFLKIFIYLRRKTAFVCFIVQMQIYAKALYCTVH